jgi:hypothetical protein
LHQVVARDDDPMAAPVRNGEDQAAPEQGVVIDDPDPEPVSTDRGRTIVETHGTIQQRPRRPHERGTEHNDDLGGRRAGACLLAE